jgi:hypothetical protein
VEEQHHNSREATSFEICLAGTFLEGCMLGVIIPGTPLDWKKNDLFLKNLVLGKQIGKKQSRGLPRGLPGTK